VWRQQLEQVELRLMVVQGVSAARDMHGSHAAAGAQGRKPDYVRFLADRMIMTHRNGSPMQRHVDAHEANRKRAQNWQLY